MSFQEKSRNVNRIAGLVDYTKALPFLMLGKLKLPIAGPCCSQSIQTDKDIG